MQSSGSSLSSKNFFRSPGLFKTCHDYINIDDDDDEDENDDDDDEEEEEEDEEYQVEERRLSLS